MSMVDEDTRRREAVQRERELLAGRSGEPKSKVFNVLSELFGNKGRLSQVDQQQVLRNVRQAEQDTLAAEKEEFRRGRLTQSDEIAADDRTIELQRQQEEDARSATLKSAQFLQQALDSGVDDLTGLLPRVLPLLRAAGITDEETENIPAMVAENPDFLPGIIAALQQKKATPQSRVKAQGRPRIFQLPDGTQISRQAFDNGSFTDTPLEGARLVADIQKGERLEQGERRVDVAARKLDPSVRGGIKAREKAEEFTVKRLNEALPEARNAQVALVNSQRALDLIDEGIRTGSFASARQETSRFFADILGISQENIPQTDEFFARMGLEVAEQIKSFGAGTGLSDADREFASKIVGGSITLDEEAIRNLVNMRRKINSKRITDYNRDRDAFTKGDARLQSLYPRLGEEEQEAPSVEESNFDAKVRAILEGAQ